VVFFGVLTNVGFYEAVFKPCFKLNFTVAAKGKVQ